MIKKHPVLFLFLLGVCVVLLAAVLTGLLIMNAASGDPGSFQYLVVLGCSVNGDTPSPMLSDRIRAAHAYLTAQPDVNCIVSGGKGNGENPSEAQCMYNELTRLGIDGSRILLEDKTTSTRENLAYSMTLLEEITGTRPETVGILSSEFHLLRAHMFAREQNVTAVCISAATSRPAVFWKYFFREILMVWYYSTLGRII